MSRVLRGKRIAVGVSGGIAAFKAAELVSKLVKEGSEVRVAMTPNATRFVSPLTFATLSRNPVITSTFTDVSAWRVDHVELARWADAMVIAPATANVIGKVASGIGDDFLTTCVMAMRCPVLVVPAMNSAMWDSPAVRRNVRVLRADGFHVMEPEEGMLACQDWGKGRMPSPERIIARLRWLLAPKDLAGVRTLVTAGPTREHIDPVRYISNPSSGKMGYAIAAAAVERGAIVTLVAGPTQLEPPEGVNLVQVVSAKEMYHRVLERFPEQDVVIKAAAVSDYRPAHAEPEKIKKSAQELLLRLERTEDILEELGSKKGDRILVGFAAETTDLVEHAMEKVRRKNLDLIVVNDVSPASSGKTGFESDTNAVKLIDSQLNVTDVPLQPKADLAHVILDKVVELLERRKAVRAQ
ncbi:MAG: bifunctional phosphopantothenoylcysteine decarboxylase/phosphopantothenate--cysteine ligase CoaBC [Bacillota bacterium]